MRDLPVDQSFVTHTPILLLAHIRPPAPILKKNMQRAQLRRVASLQTAGGSAQVAMAA